MENVCHTLAGFALARAGLRKTTPLATTALVVGANLPDLDLAWSSFRSVLVYYHEHRGFTHSIGGFAVLSLSLWILLLVIDRRLPSRRLEDRAKPFPLLVAAAIGVASHLLMDAANSYGIRPLLPWSDRWVYGDLWVIVDPWLWLFLGGAVYISGPGGGRRDRVWLAGAAIAACIVLFTPVVPAVCRVVWATGLLTTLVVCRAAARGPGDGSLPARAGLGLVVVYATLCAISHQTALGRVGREAAGHGEGGAPTVAALPRPADPFRWEGIIADASTVRHGTVDALPFMDGTAAAMTTLPRGLDDPAAVRLLTSCAGEVIREFFRFPFATLEEDPGGGRVVVVRDARYTREGRGFAAYAAPLDGSGEPIIDRRECP
jgi:inner membrane protein